MEGTISRSIYTYSINLFSSFRLSQDLVYEKCHSNDFNAIKKLDFVQCGLKHVDLSPVSSLDNLVR